MKQTLDKTYIYTCINSIVTQHSLEFEIRMIEVIFLSKCFKQVLGNCVYYLYCNEHHDVCDLFK